MDEEAVEETMNMLVDETTATNKENSSTPVNNGQDTNSNNLSADRIDFSKGLPVNLTDLGLTVDGRQRFDMPDKPSTPEPISPEEQPLPCSSGESSSTIEEEPENRRTPHENHQDAVETAPDNKIREIEKQAENLSADERLSDTSSVCEILDDDDAPPAPAPPPKPAFGSLAAVLKAAQNNTLFQQAQNKPLFQQTPAPPPLQSTTIDKEEFLKNFIDYVQSRIEPNPDLKLMDAVGQYFDEQSRSRPLGVRKLMESSKICKPTSIVLPPSQVVEMIAEFDPDQALNALSLSDSQTPLMSTEQAHRIQFAREPCPNFTRVLYDLGFSLTLESTYHNIITKRSKEKDGSDSSASLAITRLKKTYDELKERNNHFKVRQHRCKTSGCTFTTDTLISLDIHRQTPHRSGTRWLCAVCNSFRSYDRSETVEHYQQEHGLRATFDDQGPKAACPLCDDDFHTKLELKLHFKECRIRNQGQRAMAAQENDKDILNKWLWPKPRTTPNAFQAKYPKLNQIVASVQPKEVRKSVHDIVDSVVGGEGRLMPRLIAPSAARPPGILATNGPAYLVRNGNSYSILNAGGSALLKQASAPRPTNAGANQIVVNYVVCCEICDAFFESKISYIDHLRDHHKKLTDKTNSELIGPAPLACSRCKERFYTYEGLERHLLMKHSLVTSDLLQRAHKKQDNGKCKLCGKVYAFNLLHHLVQDHKQNLCSAEILYSCDLCPFQCKSYVLLESHLRGVHTNGRLAQNKRPLFNFQPPASSTPKGPPMKRPLAPAPVQQIAAKAPRLQLANGVRYRSDAQVLHGRQQPVSASTKQVQRSVASKSVSASRPAPVKKTLRYCCTPCALKFATYDEVIAHWSDKHLNKILIKLCRIDRCDSCQKKIASDANVNMDFTEYEPAEDDDLQIIDEKSKNHNESDEIICLD